MSPHVDQFDEVDHEVFIPFDEAGEARFPRRAPDVSDDPRATEGDE